jgi:aminoglycoside phosphotransferase (APT) family kinase protein
MDGRENQLQAGLSSFLAAEWLPGARVSDLARIPGGASRETWRLKAHAGDAIRGMVVRIDPETSLIDTDRRTEYRAMEAAFKAGLPAPETLFLEEDLRWLGRPFSITAEVTGCQASPGGITLEHRDAIGRQKWSLLGRIAALDPLTLGLADVMAATTPATCAMEQLDYWAKVIETDELHPNPVAHAAIRSLRRNPPPPAQKLSLVHGDYRTGNFLYSPDGEIKAILDWEMAHIGDPLEDLAWSLDPLWCWNEPDRAGGLLPHKEAVRIWEESAGLEVDPEAFRWWQVFAALKGIGIWISSSEDFHSGASKAPILAIAGWLMTDRQQRILVDYLSPHSMHRFVRVVK